MKMKKVFLYINMLFTLMVCAQNEQLALHYYEKGQFEKALISYQDLLKNQPGNSLFFQKTVDCYQQLKQLDLAETIILSQWNRYKQAPLLVELGANYQLQQNETKATKYYNQALERIKDNPSEVYGVAAAFERKALIDYALQAYELALKLEPKFNFNFQMALLYGQKGATDKMIDKFLIESFQNPQNLILIQSQLALFMTEENSNGFNDVLRKALLVRVQKEQEVFWNEFLSWFYTQRKEYAKAFVQEKAIYKRNPESLNSLVNLGELAIEEKDTLTATEILTYILENTHDLNLQVQVNCLLMEIRIDGAQEKEYKSIEADLSALLNRFGASPYTIKLQMIQAHFLAFKMRNPAQARVLLNQALQLPLNVYQMATVKMELADVLLYEEKFNQALLYYSQIEEDLKNDVVGHEASLKAAKTSYFKADFDWALKQFKELKTASSQLIANDALEYFLLINDNTVADSTQTALKRLARADYLVYQNRNTEALAAFESILKDHKGQEIESVTLLRLGQTLEKLGDYTMALSKYQLIIDEHSEGIYSDEALYFAAEIYNKQLKQIEKAKSLYEKIVFHHEDSIYFVEARKKYRQLRGDTNL